jgi:DNA-binding LacI/PurR family transcriptional regulator
MADVVLELPGQHKRRVVADSLRTLATSLTPGDRLPSAPELARQFGVASGTVHAAVEVLRREGLIVRRKGSGTFVAERPSAVGDRSPGARLRDKTKSRTIAVFALSSNPFFQNCVEHLITEAAARGLAVECRYADDHLTLEDALRFEALGPAGFVVVGMSLEWLAAALRERGHPVVLIGDPNVDAMPSVPTVYADAEYAGYLAAKRLLLLGHRRIVYAHRMGTDEKLYAKRRWRGHERALREAGIPEPHRVVGHPVVQAWMNAPDAARRYFTAASAPTAVVTWYDAEAVMIIDALRRAGLQAPDDVSVIGYDNLPIGAHYVPPLDTIDLHMDEQVRHALSLLSLPAPPAAVSATLITPTLVCRASCAPPRSA